MFYARQEQRSLQSSNNNSSDEEQQHQRRNGPFAGYAQSSAESNTSATNSLTASTTSLLGQQWHKQQRQQEQQQQLQQYTTTITNRRRSHATAAGGPVSTLAAYANAQRPFRSKRTTNTTNRAAGTLATYATTQRADYGAPFAAANANPYERYPGAATRHNPASRNVLQAGATNAKATYKDPLLRHGDDDEAPTVGERAYMPWSMRRIRRPKQSLPPTIAAEGSETHASPKANMIEKGKAFIVEFLGDSSIHGFVYLAKVGLNFLERILWFVFICVALFSIISLSKRTWERFQTSPTVISMDRNKLVWNTSFPSLTVCPHKRIDELKVDEYISLHSEQFESDEDKEDFRDFIVKLASLSYENIETLPINKTFGIASEKYLDILYELKWDFEPEISSGAAVQMYIYETLTEFGICHSVNSLVARYNSFEYWKNNDWKLLDHGDRVTVHPLDGEIYAQIINLSTAYDVYFHGAGDVPNISKQRYTFPESDYTTVELIALEIYTAEAARAFSTKQRKCRFQYEAEDMLTVPIYSFGLCLAECRMFFTLRICGCVPHFYRNRLKNGRTLPVCGFQGLQCLATIKREIITLKSDKYKIACNCLSNCDDSNFFVQSYRSRVWFLGANLQWGIIDYPKMQLRRDVLFSFADVLVYIGGLVGFFLGCSALSFTEIIYFFTARLIRRMFIN